MLMSKSRLEKFLYALYSLDPSDLPTPLSRIEELYKCLVTGEEVPNFKPLSRIEKYLMVILGVYDVDSLPNPLSRVEVLLYKLATGDDSLEDFDTFLSEHEYLLAEIIRNGGVGGNIDIEYVLYSLSEEHNTLYNTAEKPVKSAILKGQTLVNIKGNQVTIGAVGRWGEYLVPTVKPNTRYLITYDLESTSSRVAIGFLKNTSTWSNNLEEQGLKGQFILNSGDEPNYFRVGGLPDTVTTVKGLNIIEYQEGMENWDIPFFEGMQSVKMPVLTTTGKNLLDTESLVEGSYWSATGHVTKYEKAMLSEQYIRVKPSTRIYFSYSNVQVLSYDINKKFINRTQSNAIPYLVTDGVAFIRLSFYNTETYDKNIMVTMDETPSPYVPFKSNILTCNEEVELHRIGDIKDELNLLTGELTQCVGKVVLDGSIDETWHVIERDSGVSTAYVEGYVSAYTYLSNFQVGTSVKLINDKGLPRLPYVNSNSEGLFYLNTFIGSKALILRIDKSKVTNSIREYLQANPITVQYQLATKSIKTVDLLVVDQDVNDTKLSTFNDITHVTLSSEGLIPEAELEVATKNEEVLNTMSLEMDDISTTQNILEETSNIQSENVDSTMIATTEIYEELL